MKKLTKILAAVTIALALTTAFTSCLTTSSSSSTSSSKSSNQVTIKMYDNCPEDNYAAILAQAGIKAIDSSYTGVVSFSYSGTPSASSIQPILTYTTRCKTIQSAITKVAGKTCTLTYNTSKNGSGTTLDFSSTDAALTTLAKMIAANQKEIYAIYTY